MTPLARNLLCVLVILTARGPAHAETLRLAVLVGNNGGSGERPSLRYAEKDAAKLAGVLTELGDVAPENLHLLQGRNLASVRDALAQVARRVSAARATPDTRVVVLFYFSGHSDGASLELGRERLPYADLRRWLAETQADVRVAIVDSCRSGALLRLKGGRPGPGFELQLTDELHSTGQALLSSSAENEMALESREVGGSFFTHHLVSGLRGAADVSGDGLVTLAEAYQYAYAHTVSATADVLLGGQHPVYDYQLTGKGDFVLTQLTRPGAVLELPPDFQRVLLRRPGQGLVLAELGPGAVPRLAIPSGDYELRMWRGGQQHSATVSAPAGQVRRVRWEELDLVAPSDTVARAKGSETPSAPVLPALRIALGGGIRDAAARGLGPLQALRAEGSGMAPTGPTVALELARGVRPEGREFAAALVVGYQWGARRGAFEASAGPEAGVQFLRQSSEGQVGWTLAPSLGPAAALSWWLFPRVALHVGGRVPLAIMRRDEKPTLGLFPGMDLGLRVGLR
ncbi:caspase family protein [Pyxidicoccus caerfyrddinensis]|uniref:caspase family protein n=1 Tax=Pyxidicoccus caerfyrddinensis TaxID=2709663 RepID=UPI0013DBF0C2|nr:caspase family protein [Pyxidicoccus caerfyrddinensis]